MMSLLCDLLSVLNGRTLATAESCTGGMVGAAITSVEGISAVYKGGVVSYTNEVKQQLLDIKKELLDREGAVSAAVAQAMAQGVKTRLGAEIGVSTTGLAGPGGDDFGNPVGTVYIGYSDAVHTLSKKFLFEGSREDVRRQATEQALQMILDMQK